MHQRLVIAKVEDNSECGVDLPVRLASAMTRSLGGPKVVEKQIKKPEIQQKGRCTVDSNVEPMKFSWNSFLRDVCRRIDMLEDGHKV